VEPSRDDEQLRDQLMQLAGRVFASLGYDGADMQMIADGAGLPLARVIELGGDKSTLYFAVFTRLHELEQVALSDAMNRFTPDISGIQRIGDAFLDFCLEYPQFVGMWMHRWQGDAADLDVETPFAVPVLAAMYELMGQAVRSDLDLELAIWNVVWAVHGFVSVGIIGSDGRTHGPTNPATIRRFRAYLRDLIGRMS
jgi:AcrR family transcriptional regulator